MVPWYIGAGINIIGSIAINLGTNIMKLGHNKRAMLDMPEEEKPSVTRFRAWQIGTFIFICGNVANFVSFAFAAQSLLSALGSVQFVSNVIFASFVLKEKISWLILLATTCIIGGCLILVIFGNHETKDYTVDELLRLYEKPPMIVFLVMMFIFVFGSYILYLHGKSHVKQKRNTFWVRILPVSYSIFSALLGTQSVLFSKSLSVLLRTTINGDNQLGNWYTYVSLLCFLITAAFWVTRLNKGLRMFPAMIIVPLMQISWSLFSIVSGMIYFQEYKTFDTLSACMFGLGVAIVFIGVVLLTKSGEQQAKHVIDEEAKAEIEGGVEMTENPVFDDGAEGPADGVADKAAVAAMVDLNKSHKPEVDPDIPKKGPSTLLNMDTYRFTSLAANTGANVKTIYKAQLNQTRRQGNNSTMASVVTRDTNMSTLQGGRSELGDFSPNTTLARTEGHTQGDTEEEGTRSMMDTLKKKAKQIHQRLKSDWTVDPNDMKQMFGLGQGSMPAISLFAMPAVDMMASGKQSKKKQGHDVHNASSIMQALPQSRFFGQDVEAGQMEAIQEQPSVELDRQSEPLLKGPLSTADSGVPKLMYTNSLPGSFCVSHDKSGYGAEGLYSSPLSKSQVGLVSLAKAKVEGAARAVKSSVEGVLKQSSAYLPVHSEDELEVEEAAEAAAAGGKQPSCAGGLSGLGNTLL